MNNLLLVGKYLDQPRLVGKFSNMVPTMLIGGSALYTLNHVHNAHKREKSKEFVRDLSVFAGTIGSALLVTKGLKSLKIGNKIITKGFKGLSEPVNLKELEKSNTEIIDEFLKTNTVSEQSNKFLQKAKSKILKFSEIKSLYKEVCTSEKGKEFLNKFVPDPENIDSKHIFSEISRLSVIGLAPVLGGIGGGILGDRLTDKKWKDKIPNKIKEGAYQYLANIFLCNIGAGAALAVLEKLKLHSKSARAIGMIIGITLTGVIGGSAIANIIGKICIDPLFKSKNKHSHRHEQIHHDLFGLYSERKPELLDIGLHADDIATVAVLSGLKWIEPALPILYSISGYRAGIGYRNTAT